MSIPKLQLNFKKNIIREVELIPNRQNRSDRISAFKRRHVPVFKLIWIKRWGIHFERCICSILDI